MSGECEAVDTSCCASCGIPEIDDIKLVPCDGCDLVKYCGDDCRREHNLQHEEACNKRAAELRDEILFKQPESSHNGDCPICSLPLSFDREKSSMCYSCSKVICKGCVFANTKREREGRLAHTCPFCREPAPKTKEALRKLLMKRIAANDPVAMCFEGIEQFSKGDYLSTLECLTKAAALGDAEAHWRLARMYIIGKGVEKDEGKIIYHLEEAAIGGHPHARYVLGAHEWETGKNEKAVKHWIIAATQGEDEAIKELLKAFKEGFMKKEVLAATLRAHKAAVDATKSPQRRAAAVFFRESA